MTTATPREVRRMTPAEANAALAARKGRLIDVRTRDEFASVHATGAESIPLSELTPADVRAGETTYVICKSGTRAKSACQKLLGSNADLVLVDGGTDAWVSAGLPVVRGQSRMISVDRQVRIVVGVLVLAGVLLAAFVNPWWLLLAGFPACGLIVAGVTDVCMLANALAAAPWNRTAPADGAATRLAA